MSLGPVSRSYVLAGAIAAGFFATRDRGEVAPPVKPAVASVATPMHVSAPQPMPTLVMPVAEPAEEIDDVEEGEVEEVRGHEPITDPAEFALVFSVDGTSYLRLSSELRAKTRGTARLVVDDGVHAVVASVAASALPGELANWRNRTVLVNGTCQARVIGFAEVSRVSGDPPGSEDYWYGTEEERTGEEPTWTMEDIVADNVTLAAKLDGCSGTWARGTEYESAQIARNVEEPRLESEAIADLLASDNGVDTIQDEWKEMGGEGDWRDSVDVQATTYEHPATGEKWIFVQAYKGGGCGEAGVAEMAAYRVGKSGKVQRFTDLELAGESIQDVVDLDGDGQPELVMGGGSEAELVDLANTHHDSISVAFHHYGCGC